MAITTEQATTDVKVNGTKASPLSPVGLVPEGEEGDVLKTTTLSATAAPFYCMKAVGVSAPDPEAEEDLTLTEASAPKVAATKLMKRAKRPTEGESTTPTTPQPPAVHSASTVSTPTVPVAQQEMAKANTPPTLPQVGVPQNNTVEDAYERARDKILGAEQQSPIDEDPNAPKKRKVLYRGIVSQSEMEAYTRNDNNYDWRGTRRGGFEHGPAITGRGRGVGNGAAAQFDTDYSRSAYQHEVAHNQPDFQGYGGPYPPQRGRGMGHAGDEYNRNAYQQPNTSFDPRNDQQNQLNNHGGEGYYRGGVEGAPSVRVGRGRGGGEWHQPDNNHYHHDTQPYQSGGYSSTRGGFEGAMPNQRGARGRGYDSDYNRSAYQSQTQGNHNGGSESLFPAPSPAPTNTGYNSRGRGGHASPNHNTGADGMQFYCGPPPSWTTISGASEHNNNHQQQGYQGNGNGQNYGQYHGGGYMDYAGAVPNPNAGYNNNRTGPQQHVAW